MGLITQVQSAKSASLTATAATTTITVSQPTLGNLMIVGIVTNSQLESQAIAAAGYQFFDTNYTAWDATGAIQTQLYIAIITSASASTTITIQNPSTTALCQMAIAVEYSGFTNANLDYNANPATGTGTSQNTGNMFGGQPAELWVAVLGTRGTAAAEVINNWSSPTHSSSIVLQTSSHINTTNSDRYIAFLELKNPGSNLTQSLGATSAINGRFAATGYTLYESGRHGGIING